MSVNGPNAGLENVRLNGELFTANLVNAVIGDPTIRRTIEGASELSLVVSDPNGELRRQSFLDDAARLVADDLRFRLVKVAKSGDDITLTGEDEIIYRLRQKTGPKKANRDKLTRAQFIRRLVREAAGKDVRFFSPELTVKQPIGKSDRPKSSGADPAPGIPRNAKGLTVKGAPATVTQKKVADQVIRIALRFNPPRRALIALLCAATHESVMGTRGMVTAVDYDSIGLLQGRQIYNSYKDLRSFEYNVRRFFFRPWTGTSLGGAIAQAKAGRPIGEICQSIQGNATGDVYTQWKGEADKWIEVYFGGEAGDFGSTTIEKDYEFEVKKGEDYWTAIKRLADEVNWRAFVVGETFYYVAEPTLLEGRRRMFIREETAGIDNVDWEIDAGKRANTATITGRVGDWDAPPGTVADLDESHGPARGKWLVSEIDGTLTQPDVTITLKRASKPKPEPAPETETLEGSGGGSSVGGGAEKMIRWARATVGTREGSARQRKWASALGYSASLPWCSIWIGYGLKFICGLTLPPNPAYSGDWLSWSGGKRVSRASLKPGDLIIYDWGDGGITDHVALYIGGGQTIGGNEADSVRLGDARLSSGVGFVRPRYQ